MASAAANSAEQAILRIGSSSRQTGDIVHDGLVLIEGAVTGRIQAREIRVLSSGSVDAVLHADVLKILGSVRGAISSVSTLIGRDSEVVEAEIHCERIGIEPGARFDASTRTMQAGSITRFDQATSWPRLGAHHRSRPVPTFVGPVPAISKARGLAPVLQGEVPQTVMRVGPNSRQTGDLIHDGIVLIEGAVTGRIHAHEVRILPTGVVDASIHANTVKVMGSARGSIRSAMVLVGGGAGVEEADIQCEQIGVEPGARYGAETRTLQPGAVPRFNYETSWTRLNPYGRARSVPVLGRPNFAVLEGGAGRPHPNDEIPPAFPEERSFPSMRM